MATKKYHLYVWRGVLCDYTCGIIAAAASSEEEARKAVLAIDEHGSLARDLGGAPEVLDLPAAVYSWGSG